MIQIQETIISEDILDHDFVCNLNSCKGACCIEGEAGAPIDEQEVPLMEELYHKISPFLTEKGRQSIEKQGVCIKGIDGEWETPLIDGGECAYVIRDKKQVALCAFEQAYNQGITQWKKPISCHLYPIRLQQYSNFTAVNYSRWNICNDACCLGKELKVPIYKFVKDALIRKFGQDWYQQLEEAKQLIDLQKNNKK